jgi:uncharacterized protein (TIGR02996 family)
VTDHDALLAAVQHQPQEAVPALALADWYDENSEPEVAHIVRQSANEYRTRPGATSHSEAFAPPHWALTQANSPHNEKKKYAVQVLRSGGGQKGKYHIRLYGHGSNNRYFVWNGGDYPAKHAQALVEGLLDKGHLPYEVPPKWLAKQVQKRIDSASQQEQ